jgi:hypothetical protein
MFEDLGGVGEAAILARLDAVLDDLVALDLTSYSGPDVLALLAGLEVRVRRLAVADHVLVAEAERRGLAAERGCRSTAVMLTGLLRIGPHEAAARVCAAARLAPRVSLTGAPMPAEYPQTAAAQAAGQISPAHARIVTTTIDTLPSDIRDEQFDELGGFLVAQARQFAPPTLATIARRLTETLAPDGKEPGYRDRVRHLTIHQRPDGSSSGSFELTAHATEALLTVLDATAAPRPESDGVKDLRTAGQRRHDGLLDALLLALRADQLPTCNGVTTTILLTLTADQATTGAGLASTGHGALLPVEQALRMAGGDTRVFPVIFDKARRVESYGSAHRIFTEGQRLAMIARDQGCSFPRCSVGPNWTEAHHIVNFALGGPTSIENGTMLCGYDHDHHLAAGWSCRMIDGRPHWTPPGPHRCGSTRPRHPDATTPTSRSGSTTRDAPCASRRRGYSVTALLSDHVAADQRMCSPTRARDVGVAQERAAV